MKKTTYQIPELRDENDNIIQSGTYGKNSPLCNATNDGVLDYINNNLEYLKSAQDSAIENITTEHATKNELKRASDALTASLAQKVSADAQAITTKELTVTGGTNVPTANAGNQSKTIANTEFVQNTIAHLVDSAPETLNTLNELAKALNNDPNFATTITNMIAEKESKTDANVEYETLRQAIAAKRDTLTFDTTPTAGSTNPVTSDGIKKAIDAKTVFVNGHLVFPNGGELWVE